MRSIKIFLTLLFLCSLFVTGCGGDKTSKNSMSSESNSSVSYTYSNEPKFVIFSKGGLCGYIDKTGKEIIKPQFDYCQDFNNGVAVISMKKDKNEYDYYYGLIDSNGKHILKPEYDEISRFSEDMLAVKSEGKTGYINKKNKFVIWPKYDKGYDFHEGLAKVIVDKKVGFINKNGDYVIYPKYDTTDSQYDYPESPEIKGFKNGFTIVKKDGKFIFINRKGELVKTLDNTSFITDDYVNNRYLALINNNYGFIDALGKTILEPKYHDLSSLDKEGKIISFSYDGDKYGVLDKSFKEIIPAKYSSFILYGNNIITIYDFEKEETLLFDTKGKLLSKAKCKMEDSFSNDLCLCSIRKDDETYFGYINQKAEIVIPFKYSSAGSFSNGLASVTEYKQNEMISGYINEKGNYVWKCIDPFKPVDYSIEKTNEQLATPKTEVKKASVPTSNNYNTYYNSNNYGYNYNNYYKPSKSQDVEDAENDILN